MYHDARNTWQVTVDVLDSVYVFWCQLKMNVASYWDIGFTGLMQMWVTEHYNLKTSKIIYNLWLCLSGFLFAYLWLLFQYFLGL